MPWSNPVLNFLDFLWGLPVRRVMEEKNVADPAFNIETQILFQSNFPV